MRALDGINLEVMNGEILGLVGLYGAGKATTRILAGIMLPSSGTVIIDCMDIVKLKKSASLGVGWVPEAPAFEQNTRPVSLLRYCGRLYNIGKRDLESRIEELLKATGLSSHTDRKLKVHS